MNIGGPNASAGGVVFTFIGMCVVAIPSDGLIMGYAEARGRWWVAGSEIVNAEWGWMCPEPAICDGLVDFIKLDKSLRNVEGEHVMREFSQTL